jgi:hypothetical protein
MLKNLVRISCLLCALALTACGGGSGGGTSASSTPPASNTNAAAPANALAVVVDRGPAVLVSAGQPAANTLFASVTLCTPGSTTCETIDHVSVDTGSVGLRIVASALSGAAKMKALADPASGSPLRECVQFADGYTWGSVVVADVQIGGRKLASLPLNLIGDAAAGSAPPDCVSGPAENTVVSFGANGVLGIGNFLQDCGVDCVSHAIAGGYYVCPSGGNGAVCRATTVALDHQVPNPVGALGSDNNGVTVQVTAVPHPGALTATGTVYFGVGTQANNALGGAKLLTLDAAGTLVTNYNGFAESGSFIDSGSNGYFFTDPSLATCAHASSFYCPVVGTSPTSVAETAAISGRNGVNSTVGFTVDNADQLFAGNGTALPGLAGPSSGLSAGFSGAFDWGLPFFYGRTVFVLFEGDALNGTAGPAVGF